MWVIRVVVLCLFLARVDLMSTDEFKNSFFQNQLTDEEMGILNESGSALDDNLSPKMKSGKSYGLSQAYREPVFFDDLYFHDKMENYTITLSSLESRSELEFQVVNSVTTLEARRIDLELMLPTLEVSGACAVDRKVYGDFDTQATGRIILTLTNVSASGVALLEILDNNTVYLHISKLVMHYKYKQANTKEENAVSSGKGVSDYINSIAFKELFVSKLWRGLVNKLNTAVTSQINRILDSQPISDKLKDTQILAKLSEAEVNNTNSANSLVDSILDGAKNLLMDTYDDKIEIPEINEGFERKILTVNWRGAFVADNGTARGLSTVYRVDNTSYYSQNKSMHFVGEIGFTDLSLFYEHFQASLNGVGPSGTLNTLFRPITLQMHISVDWRDRKVFLEEFQVDQVGKIAVEVTGLGNLFNWLTNLIATWVVGISRDTVLNQLENKYQNYIREVLSNISLDDIINGKPLTKTQTELF